MWTNVTTCNRKSLRRELSRLSRLQHAHLVRLIAVCCYDDDRLCGIVVEYPIYGDLKRYLRHHAVTVSAADGTDSRQIVTNSGLT